jgi:hypothetical protein
MIYLNVGHKKKKNNKLYAFVWQSTLKKKMRTYAVFFIIYNDSIDDK